MTVRDAIFAGMSTTYSVADQARLSLDHVVRGAAAQVSGVAADTNPSTVAPQFAEVGNDPFELAAGSALVDTGSAAPLAPGESEFDLDGGPAHQRRHRGLPRASRPGRLRDGDADLRPGGGADARGAGAHGESGGHPRARAARPPRRPTAPRPRSRSSS